MPVTSNPETYTTQQQFEFIEGARKILENPKATITFDHDNCAMFLEIEKSLIGCRRIEQAEQIEYKALEKLRLRAAACMPVDDDFVETMQDIRSQAMELHRKHRHLLTKEDMVLFRIIVKKEEVCHE